MSDLEATLAALREAVRLAPDNIPLGEHFGKTLLALLRYEEAEQHFKKMLSHHPQSQSLKVMMADTYYRQNKNSHALAIVETLIGGSNPFPPAMVLYAKLMYRARATWRRQFQATSRRLNLATTVKTMSLLVRWVSRLGRLKEMNQLDKKRKIPTRTKWSMAEFANSQKGLFDFGRGGTFGTAEDLLQRRRWDEQS